MDTSAEAEFEREAAQMMNKMGLGDVEKLNYFQTDSSKDDKWKEGLRKPSQHRIRRVRAGDPRDSAAMASRTEISSGTSGSSAKFSPSTTKYRNHGRATRVKSAPEGSAAPSARSDGPVQVGEFSHRMQESTSSGRTTRIPLPSGRSTTLQPFPNATGRGIDSSGGTTGARVLYARKPSLKLLSVTTTTRTAVRFPTQNSLSGIGSKSVGCAAVAEPNSALSGSSAYDRLAGYQRVTVTSPALPLEHGANVRPLSVNSERSSFSQVSTSSCVSDELGCTQSSSPSPCILPTSSSVPSHSETSPLISTSPPSAASSMKEFSPGPLLTREKGTKDLLQHQVFSSSPDHSVAAMSILATNTVEALGTLMHVVTPATSESRAVSPPQPDVHHYSDNSPGVKSRNSEMHMNGVHGETNVVCAKQLPEKDVGPLTLKGRSDHELPASSQNTKILYLGNSSVSTEEDLNRQETESNNIEEQDDFFGKCLQLTH